MQKNTIDQPQQQQQKLSKSQSQSSILNLFKSHFSSPFLIKKFRSKSRDKSQQQQQQQQSQFQTEPQQSSSKLTLSKIKSTTKKQQQIQLKQPLLIINRNLDENTSQQFKHYDKKENILPISCIKKQQPSLTIKLSNDQLNDDNTKLSSKPQQQQQQLKSSSLSPLSIQQAVTQSPAVGSTRQLSYLQLTCLVNGYDTYSSQNGLSIQTSPSLLSTSSSLISPPKILTPKKQSESIKISPTKSSTSPQHPLSSTPVEDDEVKIEIIVVEPPVLVKVSFFFIFVVVVMLKR
jgi:hypothetical protein